MDETALSQAGMMPANQPESAPEAAPQTMGYAADGTETPFLTVRYNKEERPLTREAAAEYAQKGLNYDKINGRLSDAEQRLAGLSELETLARSYAQRRGLPETQALAALKGTLEGDVQTAINAQLAAFIQAYPEENLQQLPAAVMDEWRRGVPLKEAYLSHKAAELEARMQAYDTNARNAAASMGGATGSGDAAQKPLSEETIARMSPAELERNHSRIWAYLTGKKQ